jgi:endonuclease/exonuclease/phosphatase family metal-dependent hydrolase
LDIKTQIDPNTVVVGDFNIPLSPIYRSSRKRINKEILELHVTIDLMDLKHGYRVFHPATAQYVYLSGTHGTFLKIDHILCHTTSLKKYKKIEIATCILSDHSTIKLELNNKRCRKYSNYWRLNNTLLHDQWVI